MLALCSNAKFKLPLETFYPDFRFLKAKKSCNDTDAFCKLQLGPYTTAPVRALGTPVC